MNEKEFKNAELNESELEKVSGGWSVTSVSYETADTVVFKWNRGDHVEKVRGLGPFYHVYTTGCTVLDRKADRKSDGSGFCAWYLISADEPENNNHWFQEDAFGHGYTSIYHELIM